MKFTKIKYASLMAAVLLFQAACDPGDFGDINSNPNASETPITSALLTNATVSVVNATRDDQSGLYCQYFSESQYTDDSRYTQVDRAWDGVYAGSLYDLQTIIDANSDPEKARDLIQYGSNANQIAVAKILRAYRFSILTDQYGDIPYSQSLQKNPQIPYDTQEAVYAGLLKELKDAVAGFDAGPAAAGDILFGGDIAKWKKFANSLRLVLALRMSEADAAKGKTEFLAALNDPAGVITANDDNAVLAYPGGSYRNPWYDMYNGRKDFSISLTLTNLLYDLGDPRVTAYGAANGSGQVIGIPYGVIRDSAIAYTVEHPDWSFVLDPSLRAEDSPAYILTASDVFLARAEAASIGWTSEDAASMYQSGIQASMEQWGVYDAAAFATYMAGAKVDLAAGNALSKIQTQRYLSFYPKGLQGWSEWRRTGNPSLSATPFAVNASKQIPRRYAYPSTEPNLNSAAYEEAKSRIGDDTPDIHVWWDK